MSIAQSFKDHPWSILISSSGSIIAIVSVLFALDARYAHAGDVERDKVILQRTIQETSSTLRRQMLEDKLFELDVRKSQSPNRQLPPVDSALRERYQRQLDELVIKRNP